MQSKDAHLRGTALEYLESVLPANVLELMRSRTEMQLQDHRHRDTAEVEAELYSVYKTKTRQEFM